MTKRWKKKKPWRKNPRSREYQRELDAALAERKLGDKVFKYFWNPKQQRFDVYVVSDTGIRIKCDYPVARLYSGAKKMIPWTVESLEKHLNPHIAACREQHGGEWKLEILHKALRRKPLRGRVTSP